jgi:predicted CxxxxCH...CXXCH cytochrome family protein
MVGGQSSTESSYHDLSNWVTPEAKNLNHHGRVYFLAKAQKDEHGVSCTACHGSELEGTTSAPSCNSCHSNWRNCSSCHGTNGTQSSPPSGVGDETSIATLAVGRHTAHLTNGTSHSAFACNTCHVVPAANDITHTLGYEESNDLSTSGHHGDIVFSTLASTMTWNVNGTTGTPISARGTCTGACHSNGRGGPPAKTPYWAGGTWTNGCTNCHGAPPNSGKHSDHRNYACSECHAGATATSYTSSNHFNGKRDYSSSKMPYKNGQCSGSCHENETW